MFFLCFQVQFASRDALATVHPIIAWNYAYCAARKGPWEQYARDRARFQRKIKDLERVLNPVFQKMHRDTVYTERFSDNKTI